MNKKHWDFTRITTILLDELHFAMLFLVALDAFGLLGRFDHQGAK